MNSKHAKPNELLDSKRQDILNAAILVFSKHPYRLANTNDISASAGISKGLLFHYFATKKALYLNALEYSTRLVSKQMATEGTFIKMRRAYNAVICD
ncbi:MAG: TetR/AcrR family transcriptional regulator [Clostridiales bacterium]|jgi:AcrR family transcriptional regulator|nr:TetR/AcrR family transcriptional regulator [Clostridiales bacterium]